jgi:hypothetical protein
MFWTLLLPLPMWYPPDEKVFLRDAVNSGTYVVFLMHASAFQHNESVIPTPYFRLN